MKKLIFLLPFILIENIYSKDLNIMPVENNEVMYQEVVNLNGSYSDEDVFEAVKSFLSENNLHRKTDAGYSTGMALVGGVTISPTMSIVEANNRNRKTLVSENPPKSIRVNYYQSFQGKGAGALRTLYIDSDLKIDIKDSKYRYTLNDFKWIHYNHFTGEQMPIWGNRNPDCNDRGTLYQLHSLCKKGTKSRKKAMELINEDILLFLSELEDHVNNELEYQSSDDDW